jgi:arylsulfatase A-like enzyme/tetratricopeptide (TPR) repeat protein
MIRLSNKWIVLSLLWLPLNGCSDDGSERDARLNVLLVTIDTLRADHLGCYGADNVMTPVLDGIAAESVLFSNAASATPLTLPSHSSLFTGTYPLSHGVRDNAGFVLSDEELTLAEAFEEKGWRTAGFISAYVLRSAFGIAQGFERYGDQFDFDRNEMISAATVQRRGNETLAEAYTWLEENHGNPFFLWIHLFDPHVPYDPPEPYRTHYAKDPYAGEVAYTDQLVGELLDKVKLLGLMENTVLVFVGDHGEGRGDHQESYHGLFIYDSTIRVPLIIRAPGIPPGQVDAQVRLIDVMPTLLDLAGLEVHPVTDGGLLKGESLKPLMTGQSTDMKLLAYSETHYPTTHYGWSDLKSLRTQEYKFIEAPEPELYNMAADPGEASNLSTELPEVVDRMRQTMQEMVKRAGTPRVSRKGDDEVDSRTAEAMRQLGYTGSVAPAALKDGELPDPKEKVDVLLRLEAAQRLIAMGQSRKAVPLLRSVVKQEPQMNDARITLGVALYKAKEYELAANVFKKSIELAPETFAAWVNMGLCLRELKRDAEAQKTLEHALELDPGNLEVMDHLIDSYFASARFKKTEEISRLYLESKPDATRVRVALAMSLFNQGKSNEAREEVEKGLEVDGEGENLHYVMGKVWESRSSWVKAAEAYEQELRFHQRNINVFQSLAAAYERLGRWNKVVNTLESAVAHNPDNFNLHFMLARAYAETGVPSERALEVAKRAVELNSSSRKAWDLLERLQRME